MHDRNIILAYKFASYFEFMLDFLATFSIHVISWNDLLHVVVVLCCVFLKCCICKVLYSMYTLNHTCLLPYFLHHFCYVYPIKIHILNYREQMLSKGVITLAI